jgi:hypothetical protein
MFLAYQIMLLPTRKECTKYSGNLAYVRRNINFDIKHGVTTDEVITFFDKVRNDSSFSDLSKSYGSGERLDNLQIGMINKQRYTF